MPTTPAWSAAINGLPDDLDATNEASQVAQELGTHAVQVIYSGNAIVTPNGDAFGWSNRSGTGSADDHDQPFTMPAGNTKIGRVALPIIAVGAGADLRVSLCPDNGSGSPVTTSPIVSTIIPAAWLTKLSTTIGLSDNVTQVATGSPLATPDFNSTGLSQGVSRTWAQPAVGPNGAAAFSTPVTSGLYALLIGGFDSTNNTAQTNVASVQYLGGGILSGPTLQPPLPQAVYFAAAAATTSAVVVAGGQTTPTTVTNAVWIASWDSNTGTLGSWSAQAALPFSGSQNSMATHGDTVYVSGGISGSTVNPNMFMGTVSNGQLGNWTTLPSVPGPALYLQHVAVVGDWLIVAGGRDAAGNIYSTVYYALIQPDGSLGGWKTGPSLPVPTYASLSQWDLGTTDTAMLIIGGSTVGSAFTNAAQILETSPDGIGTWQLQNYSSPTEWQVLPFPENDATWTLITPAGSTYLSPQALKMPLVSVPLPASGLTPGAKYHVLMHQMTATPNDYLRFGDAISALPDALLYRPVYTTGPWSNLSPYAMNLTVYDQATTGTQLHTWEDPDANGQAARITTTVYGANSRLLGLCTSTLLPINPLNANPTFTSGVAPWTATGGTLSQSNAHTHGGFVFSGLLTPDGTSAQAAAKSELVPIGVPNATTGTISVIVADAWLYSTTGYSSVSLSVNWYDSAGAYLSTSSNTGGLAAATWTHVVNYFLPPATAAYAALVPTESGTPAATNVLYLSNAIIQHSPDTALTLNSEVVVDYDTTGLPTGTTLL